MYGQRMTAGTSPRYLELLELLKNECDSMHQEANMSKIHREDVEVKSTCVRFTPVLTHTSVRAAL